MMKQLWWTTSLYIFCTVVWTANFFLHWRMDGCISISTGLFGLTAVCFAISAVLNLIRIRNMKKEEEA